MKIAKLVFGALAAAYTVLALWQLIAVLAMPEGAERNLTAAIVPPAVGGAIALACFQSAFKTCPSSGDDAPAD